VEFNKKLYELRKQKGLSQDELANKLNVSRQTISKWELGESTPEMEKLIMLSDYFGISLDELILGKVHEKLEQNNNGQKTVVQVLDEKVFTKENKLKSRKVLVLIITILAVILGIDIISMIVYFVFFGIPK
jgi:transcriptional regulator with XRE-family HTH domain